MSEKKEKEHNNTKIEEKDSDKKNIINKEYIKNGSKMIGNYILFEQIGKGTFSKVTQAIHILTEQVVAVKILEKEKIEDDIDVERIIREIEILNNINHPNIAQMYEIYSTIHNIYLMMEYVEGGDLFDYIYTNKFLPEQKACSLFRQLISVIEYLNEMGITHRDIKPENILLDKDKKNIKVIDFGLSNYCTDKNLLHSSCGSPCYASPEMLSGKPYIGISTDLWSSGIVLYSMLVGSLPFDEQELQKLYEQIKIGKFYLPSTLSLEAMDLLKKLLMVDPNKRIGLIEIKNHPWFKMENNPIYKGINIYKDGEFPCNEKVVSYVIKKYFSNDKEIDIDSLTSMIKTNECNKYTATYYLAKKYILCIKDKYKVVQEENSANKKSNENNNENEDRKTRSKTEENEIIKISNKKPKKNNKFLIIPSNNKNSNILEIFNDNEYYKKSKKLNNNNKNEDNKKRKQHPSKKKNSKKGSKNELSSLNLKNIDLISNEIKKSKQKLNQNKKNLKMNLKSTIIRRKNVNTIANIKSFTEKINDCCNKEFIFHKISNLINKNNIKRKKKKSLQSSNNFNFYVINNIIHKEKPELNSDIFNIKLNNHRKNKSSSIINKKIKNMTISKKQERLNTEIGKISYRNSKIIYINDELKSSNINMNTNTNTNTNMSEKQSEKNNLSINFSNDYLNNIIKKKLSNTNMINNNNIKKRRKSNTNTNKNFTVFNNNKNLSSNNFNYFNINNNSEKITTKNSINNSNFEKKKNNLSLSKILTNKNDNNSVNKIKNTKNKKGNFFLVNYVKQKTLLNYVTNKTSNYLNRQSHQRNLSYALRHQLTNFKTDISNKSNSGSISKKREQYGNDSQMLNIYFPTERNNNNIYRKKQQMKNGDTRNNKFHQKNKVI